MNQFDTAEPVDQEARRHRSGNPYTVTIVLIAINTLIFFAMVASGISFTQPSPSAMLPWGADFGLLTINAHQYWRLLTACFLHFGIIHVGMNMFVLYQIGPFIQIVFGRIRYLLIYFFAGICGNIVSVHIHPYAVGAGASGAIFGLYGGVFAFLLIKRRSLDPQAMSSIGRSAGIFLVYNLIYGAASKTTDLSAHLGGLVAGFLSGLVLAASLPSEA